jgi:hypothetical protein
VKVTYKLAILSVTALILAGCQTNAVKQTGAGSVVHNVLQNSLDDTSFIENQTKLNKFMEQSGRVYDVILYNVSTQHELVAAELKKDTPPAEHHRKVVIEAAGAATVLKGLYTVDHGFNKSGSRQNDRFIQISKWMPKYINPQEAISLSFYYNSGNSKSFSGEFLGLGVTKNDFAQYVNITMQRDAGHAGKGKSTGKSYRIAMKRSCGSWGVSRLAETDAQLLSIGVASESCSGDDVFNITRLLDTAMLIDYQISLIIEDSQRDPNFNLTAEQITYLNSINPFQSS